MTQYPPAPMDAALVNEVIHHTRRLAGEAHRVSRDLRRAEGQPVSFRRNENDRRREIRHADFWLRSAKALTAAAEAGTSFLHRSGWEPVDPGVWAPRTARPW